MIKKSNFFVICAVFFLLTGCVSLTEEGAKVKVVANADQVKNCEIKGKIRSYSVWMNSTAHEGNKDPQESIEDSSFNNTLHQTRNAAASDLGANTVLIGGSHAPRNVDFWANSFSTEFSSMAYLCN